MWWQLTFSLQYLGCFCRVHVGILAHSHKGVYWRWNKVRRPGLYFNKEIIPAVFIGFQVQQSVLDVWNCSHQYSSPILDLDHTDNDQFQHNRIQYFNAELRMSQYYFFMSNTDTATWSILYRYQFDTIWVWVSELDIYIYICHHYIVCHTHPITSNNLNV